MTTGDASAPPGAPTSSARVASVGAGALAAFGAAALGAGLGRSILTAYLPLILEGIRDSPLLIGIVMTANPITGILVPLAVGGPADRLRRHGGDAARALVLGGAIVGAVGMLAVATLVSTGYLELALAAIVAYAGLAAGMTMHRSLVAERFAPPLWARATGAQEIGLFVGAMLGLGVGATIVVAAPLPFVIGAVLVVLVALPTLGHPLLASRRGASVAAPRPSRPRLGDYLSILRRPGARVVIMVEALWVFGYAALPAFFLLYSEEVLDLRPVTASGLLLGFAVLAGAATVVAGNARTLEHRRRAALVSALGLGIGLAWVAVGTTPIAVAPGLLVAAIGFGVISALGFPLFSAFAARDETGTITAVFFATRSLAAAMALVASGALIALVDDYRAVFAMGVAPVLASVVLLIALRAPPVRRG